MWPWEQQQFNAQAAPVEPPAQIPTQDLPGLSYVVEPTPTWLPEKRPPATPEEFEQRKVAWQGILDRIQNDPMLRQTLLTVGVRMMQGRRPGQTTGGAIAESIGLGAAHYGMLEHNAKAEEAQAAEQARKNKETDANIELRKSQAEENKAQTERLRTLIPVEKELKDLDLKKKQAEADLQAAIDAADPGGIKRAQATLKSLEQEIAYKEAQTSSSRASAWSSSEMAQERAFERKQRTILADPTATEEQKKAAREALSSGKGLHTGANSAQVQMLEAFKENYRKMNPQASEQDVAKAGNDWLTQQKKATRQKEIADMVLAGIISGKEGRAILEAEGLLPVKPQGQSQPANTNRQSSGIIVREIK